MPLDEEVPLHRVGGAVRRLLRPSTDGGRGREWRPLTCNAQVYASPIGTEHLLNGERPELAQILQLLNERGVVEDAKAGANDRLVIRLIRHAQAGSDVGAVGTDQGTPPAPHVGGQASGECR